MQRKFEDYLRNKKATLLPKVPVGAQQAGTPTNFYGGAPSVVKILPKQDQGPSSR